MSLGPIFLHYTINTQCCGDLSHTCELHSVIHEQQSSPWPSPTRHSTAIMQNSVPILSSWSRERSDRLIALSKILDRCPESVAAEVHRLAESSGNVDPRLALSEEEGSEPLPIAADESSPESLDGRCYRCSVIWWWEHCLLQNPIHEALLLVQLNLL